MSRAYLEQIKLTSFGRFRNHVVGSLGPGLNIVYGPNEAGKTTTNELVRGVLFGWPNAHGQNNSYRPEAAERAGSLFFRCEGEPDLVEVKRLKNADEVDEHGLFTDIDRETFNTMFALNADELMGLEGHTEVTARLLTAGSGTKVSPATALAQVDERIKQQFSRSALQEESIPNLKAQQAQLREEVAARRAEAEALRGQEQELAHLEEERSQLEEQQEQLNTRIERLKSAQALVASLDEDLAQARTALYAEMNRTAAPAPAAQASGVSAASAVAFTVAAFLLVAGLALVYWGGVSGNMAFLAAGIALVVVAAGSAVFGVLHGRRIPPAPQPQPEPAGPTREDQLRRDVAEKRRQRVEACRAAGLSDAAQPGEFANAIAAQEAHRATTAQHAAHLAQQCGRISQQLEAASTSRSFAEAKFAYEQVTTRLTEAYRTLTVLLLARKTLESAIQSWEHVSQPEVYRTASRLFSAMTEGKWQQVRTTAQGGIEVVDAVLTAAPPHLLSLGTRQQLYLSLRIALLLTAQNVGRNVPVLCDDILVNFDEKRRRAAAGALAELARSRQVIFFTCHPDVAALVRDADPSSNMLEL